MMIHSSKKITRFLCLICFIIFSIRNLFTTNNNSSDRTFSLTQTKIQPNNNNNNNKNNNNNLNWLIQHYQDGQNAHTDHELEFGLELPIPVQVLQQYIQQHGNHILQNESNEQLLQRKYSIVYYWCPNRLGNLLHNMFNSMIMSIITNRTLLIAYDESGLNTQQQCEDAIQLQSWVPKYEKWHQKLNINTTDDNIPISIPLNVQNINIERQIRTVIFPQMYSIRDHDSTIHRNPWAWHPLSHWSNPWTGYVYDQYFEALGRKQNNTAYSLYEYGVEFLMGMLLRETFDLQLSSTVQEKLNLVRANNNNDNKNNNNNKNNKNNKNKNILTIGLHTRHLSPDDIGNYTNDEIDCLNQLLPPKYNNTLDTCYVYLMSDRELTINILSSYIQNEKNCTPISMINNDSNSKKNQKQEQENHNNGGSDNGGDGSNSNSSNNNKSVGEHGERAGDGFIEDLKLVSQARDGFISIPAQSSTMLVYRLIMYDRIIEAYKNGHDIPTMDSMLTCNIPERADGGYNYGPGTPTFYGDAHQHLKIKKQGRWQYQ